MNNLMGFALSEFEQSLVSFGESKGARAERERIIKLLEEHTHPEAKAEYLIDCDFCERYYGVGLALALIKGEQK